MSHKPVFLFVFANDVAQSLQLDKEWREAEYALQKDEDAGKIIFNLTPKATLDDIWDKFNRFHNQVAIFHYGGHSNNEVLDLEDTSLEGKSLATLVGQEQNLKLVFLNGCANAGLVELLFKQSIPAVIATTAVINDQRAINLSKHFYIALSNGKTIKEAFFTAASYVNNGEKEVLVDYRGGGALQEKQQFEWGLYVQDESILDWRIGTATSNLQKIVLHRLRQISRGRYKKFASKGGRFYSLEIRDAILAGIKNIKKHHRQFIEEHVSLDGVSQSFAQSVSLLWQKNCSHAMIIGAGGMGKTVSLLRLWKQWTNTESHYCPVPIFIQLNEFNYRPEKDFIRNYIQEHYGGVNINELIRVSNPDSNNQHSPQIILLLDGLNEVTAQSNELILEINQLKTQENFPGLQIVLTSRTDLRATHQWQVFHLLELQALTTEQIDNYLEKQIPSDIRLIELLGNPMMLSIYAAQSNLPQRYYDKSLLKEQITSTGEMLYNVEAVQRIKIEEQFATEPREQIFRRFVLEFVVPYTAWNMQQSGVFSITEQDAGDIPGLITLLSRIKKELLDPDFFRFFKSFRKLDEDDSFQGIKDWKLIEKIIDQICCEELVVLVNENETYRFLHQNFRDYFAARHVQNQMSLAIKKKALPDVLRQAPLGFYVRQILGELEGEHYNKLVWLENEKQWSNDYPIQNNHIAKQIELCRNVFDQGQLGYTAWNILTIWKEQRKELSSANLHKLHFFDFTFNTVRSSRPGLAARLSRGKLDKENLFPQGHSDNVTNAVYSSNDNRIITASDDRTAKVWDVQSGTCILTLKGHTENISKATCSLDSSRIITASDDRTAKVWDTQSGSCILTLEGHKDWVNDVVYSPDGNQIITASEDRTIKVWDAQSGTCILTLEEHFTSVNSVAYSPDGNQIITASKDRTAKIWDVQSGTCILTLEGHTKEVNSATYSSDGYQIVTTSDDGTAKVWDVQSGTCILTLEGHNDKVNSAVYSSDGYRIITASDDGTAKVWDVQSGTCILTLEGHNDKVNSATYNSNDSQVITASKDKTTKVWDTQSGTCILTLKGYSSSPNSVAYSPDSSQIITASKDGTTKVWDAQSGICILTLEGHTNEVNSAVYSSDGYQIVTTSDDGTAKVWDVQSGTCILTLEGHNDKVNSATYNSNDSQVITASDDGTAKIWDVQSGTCILTLEGHTKEVNSATYNSNDSQVITASNDGTAKVWDAQSGICIFTMHGQQLFINYAVYSPNDSQILTITGLICAEVWDAQSGTSILTMKAHNNTLTDVVYSPDGSRIITTSHDHTAKVWDIQSGTCLLTLEGHFNSVKSAAFSNNGKHFITAAWDKTVKVWDAQSGACILTLPDLPGLMIQGCDFRKLHIESNLSEKDIHILRQYGAIFNEEDKKRWDALMKKHFGIALKQ